MPFAVSSGQTRIYFDVLGTEGPHVVLIQGLGLSSTFWFDLPRRLTVEGARPCRVVVLDNRGVGRSDRPWGPYRVGQLADDVAAVLDAAGAARAFVIGISLGGMIAQHVALRHPARVSGLGLLATTPGLPYGVLPAPETLWDLVVLPLRRDPRAMARVLLSKKHLPQARRILARWPEAVRAEPVVPRVFFAQLAAAAGHAAGPRLGGIRCPTAVVAGAEDNVIPPQNSAVLARRIPGAVLEILPDVGHAIPAVDDQVLVRTVGRLRELAAA
jgi:pimeloyl-ACP methyl ester carboxylesterase